MTKLDAYIRGYDAMARRAHTYPSVGRDLSDEAIGILVDEMHATKGNDIERLIGLWSDLQIIGGHGDHCASVSLDAAL